MRVHLAIQITLTTPLMQWLVELLGWIALKDKKIPNTVMALGISLGDGNCSYLMRGNVCPCSHSNFTVLWASVNSRCFSSFHA
mgnify:CR=1 FL=1